MENTAIKKQNQETGLAIPQDGSVEFLIAKALDKDTPVEVYEKLLAMRREVRQEWTKAQFDEAMAKFQMECPVIGKDKKVDFTSKRTGSKTNYSYAPLDEIVRQTKELISKNGFSYTIQTENTPTSIASIVTVRHEKGWSEQTRFEVPIDKESYMSAQQQYGAASTFGKRYAFLNAFGILTGDEDNDAVHNNGGKQSTQSAPQPTYHPDPQNPPTKHYCLRCDKKLNKQTEITEAEAGYSKKLYGFKLCRGCQAEAKKAQNPTPAPKTPPAKPQEATEDVIDVVQAVFPEAVVVDDPNSVGARMRAGFEQGKLANQ